MNEYQLLLEQVQLNRQLVWLAIILFSVMFVKELLLISRIIRRYLGFQANGDMLDDLTYGQFTKAQQTARAQANARAQWAVRQTNARVDQRANAIDQQQKIARRKFNTMLIIMRDLRTFTIFGVKPVDRDVPIEADEDDGLETFPAPREPQLSEEIDKESEEG